MVIVDTHCHLFLSEYDLDLEVVLERAATNQVRWMIVAAIDARTSCEAVRMAEQYEMLYAAVGIHPNSLVENIEDELSLIRSLVAHPKVVAIGEIGLDYYRTYVSPTDQKYRLSKQLEIASESKLPLILHNRDAIHDLYPLVCEWAKQVSRFPEDRFTSCGVFHSFSEDDKWARQVVEMGFYIGISGVVTFPKAYKIKDVVRSISLNRLLVETDAPYLCPQPCRGKRNEPANIVYTVQEIANLSNVSVETVADTTTKNAQTLFGIG